MKGHDRPSELARSQQSYAVALNLVHRHDGALDFFGLPKPDHFERVAANLLRIFPAANPAQIQAALLHDALEPDNLSIEILYDTGVLPDAIRMIQQVTLPQPEGDYLAYICRLIKSGDMEAMQVKLADNIDAVNLLRKGLAPEASHLLEGRYLPSCTLLSNALNIDIDLFSGKGI